MGVAKNKACWIDPSSHEDSMLVSAAAALGGAFAAALGGAFVVALDGLSVAFVGAATALVEVVCLARLAEPPLCLAAALLLSWALRLAAAWALS